MSSTAMNRRLFAIRWRSDALRDAAIAAAAFTGTLVLLAIGGMAAHRAGLRGLDVTGVVLAAASTVPLVAWRRGRLPVFVVTAAASAALVGLGYPLDLMVGPAVALYLLAAGRDQSSWTWRTTATVVGLLAAYLAAAAVSQQSFPGTELLHSGLACAVAWFAGERTRLRHDQIAELSKRAVRAEREVERERRLAAAEERARIARDLHDSAGHAINVIAVRAGAARLRHRQDPDRSLAALEAIEDVARQTAADIDQIVGALRSDEPAATEVEAPTGLASLSTLIEQHREAGVKVDVERHGRPRGLSPAIDQAAYRILQEALTNAARHGDGMAHIELRFSDEWLELTVTNRMPEPAPPPSPRGHGLIGLRERATLLGGTLDVEHRGDSFRIRAGLPYGVHPA